MAINKEKFLFLVFISASWEFGAAKKSPSSSIRLPVFRTNLAFSKDEYVDPGRSTAPISSGDAEYFVQIGIGTPVREFKLALDTGSSLSWVQCSDCFGCDPNLPFFASDQSSSYINIACESPICSQLRKSTCRSFNCSYEVIYGENFMCLGDLATDIFSFQNGAFFNISFGCAKEISFKFKSAGVFGIGGGPLSFISQIGVNAFSYCLPIQGSTGDLTLGPPSSSAHPLMFTPMVRDPEHPTFYFVNLKGISVGGSLIPTPQYAFTTSDGQGGFVIDSGTSVTRLPPLVYRTMKDVFILQMQRNANSTLIVNTPPPLDTCFFIHNQQHGQLPQVVLHFENDVHMVLHNKNVFIRFENSDMYCLGFLAMESEPFGILGNVQQQGFRFFFDLDALQIGIASEH